MQWLRNSGPGDHIGARVNMNRARPKYHAAREDWVRSGQAVCGADIGRAGFEWCERVGIESDPPDSARCKDCFRALERRARELARLAMPENVRFIDACMNRGLHLR